MRALLMHRSLLFFGYELIVDAFRLLQMGAHDVSARHAPRVSSCACLTLLSRCKGQLATGQLGRTVSRACATLRLGIP